MLEDARARKWRRHPDRAQGRDVERMANSGLMLNPEYIKGMEKYLQGVGGKKG